MLRRGWTSYADELPVSLHALLDEFRAHDTERNSLEKSVRLGFLAKNVGDFSAACRTT